VRHIYVDEAGTSEPEPVTVVVGLIVDDKHQYAEVEGRLSAIVEAVPRQYRSGFVSHATDIWNNRSLREAWPFSQRFAFLKSLAGIPEQTGVPLSFAFVRRSNPVEGPGPRSLQHHRYAFGMCIAHADRYIRNFGTPNEKFSIVAEDVRDRRRHLSSIAAQLTMEPFRHPSLKMKQFAVRSDGIRFETSIVSGECRISRVEPPIRFVPKQGSPLLQIADACAFGLRRFLADLKGGEEVLSSISNMFTCEDRDLMMRSFVGSQIVSQQWPDEIRRSFSRVDT